jgi:hypothetical protein
MEDIETALQLNPEPEFVSLYLLEYPNLPAAKFPSKSHRSDEMCWAQTDLELEKRLSPTVQ